VHIVVNHLRLRDPLPPSTAGRLQEVVESVVAAGGLAARVAKVDERHLVLILQFACEQDAERVAREVGGPWMREHIVPLLAGGTERSVGEVIAAAES
jgi:hypothetical protein